MIKGSVLCVNVSCVYGMNVKKPGLPRGFGPLTVERPARRRSEQQINQQICQRDWLSNGRTKDGNVPPFGDLLVCRHKASVDIRLLGERATSLSPDLFTVVKEDVGEGSRDRSERP
jgi:hypothetical protein